MMRMRRSNNIPTSMPGPRRTVLLLVAQELGEVVVLGRLLVVPRVIIRVGMQGRTSLMRDEVVER
jgi:hypothetical protein